MALRALTWRIEANGEDAGCIADEASFTVPTGAVDDSTAKNRGELTGIRKAS